MDYKFIKDTEFAFGKFTKGDVIRYDEEFDKWIYAEDSDESQVMVTLNEGCVKRLIETGSVISLEAECCCCNDCACDKIGEVTAKIDELLETYERNHAELIEQYNEGDLPACIKVEADTVYFNLTKVLNEIKGMLNE